MCYQLLQDLATLHQAELRQAAAARREVPARRVPSWRERTGWTLVNVGLRLAAYPPAHPQPQPRTG
jgi:hypothetical protein